MATKGNLLGETGNLLVTFSVVVLLGHRDDVVEQLLNAVSVHPTEKILVGVLSLGDQLFLVEQIVKSGLWRFEQRFDLLAGRWFAPEVGGE